MAKLVIGTDKTVATPALIKVVEVPAPEKYPLLSRVKDDSNNEIGTVACYHIDANNQKYAVVCLDAQYRSGAGKQYLSQAVSVTGLPRYGGNFGYAAKETATDNCDKILAFIEGTARTSSAVTFCRSHSFVIEGTTYYGQLPNAPELFKIMTVVTDLNSKDPTATTYSGLTFADSGRNWWASTQYDNTYAWTNNYNGVYSNKGGFTVYTLPVLEIPID